MSNPPLPKYRYTLEVDGNSHEEILSEIMAQVNGGYMYDSLNGERDEFEVVGGRATRMLKHTNPEMTPERYDKELVEWWQKRKAGR